EVGDVLHQDAVFWWNLFFLAVVSGSFATTVYFIAAEKLGSYRTSSFVFLVPSSAMLLSWLFLAETPDAGTIIGGTIAVSAVYVINKPAPS
ncbi:MAG TPA: DMT family transporter, partial [Dissulfurispiraceae bacterium]|nr:DMT family transporter [Dissulfurispiraceae bacterium]